MKYLITGGTGFIGTRLIKDIVNNNHFAIILSRKKIKSTTNCTFINDLSLIKDDEKIDCIINLAGKPIDCRWTENNKKELINSRVSITRALVSLVQRLKIKPLVIVSASAVGFYGNYNNETLDESSMGKKSFTYELCQKWENEILKAKKHGVRVCIMRLGVVLGKEGGFIKKISLPFKLGLGGKIGSGKQFFPWIHIEDVVFGIHFIIQNKGCVGVYNFVSPITTTNEKLTQYIGSILNRPVIFNIPSPLIKIIFKEMGENLLLQGNNIIPKRLLEQNYIFKYTDIGLALNNIFNN